MTTLENSGIPETAILGTGSMGGAILKGLLSKARLSAPVRVTTRSADKAAVLREQGNTIVHSVEEDPQANIKAVRGADVVILGVKPAQILEVLSEVSEHLKDGAVVVSVAAGVSIANMESLVSETVSIVRAMPNTPSLIGEGLTGVTVGGRDNPLALDVSRALFNTVGDVLVVESEEKLDALSAVSGSGPAYVFFFIEEFTRAAKRLGFNGEEASLLAEQTFFGAVNLLDSEQLPPEELRRQVTSPKGTTERAIQVFQAANLGQVFDEALAAAVARATELAQGAS